MRLLVSVTFFVAIYLVCNHTVAAQIGINIFGGRGPTSVFGGDVTGLAGAPGYAQSNWNNVAIPGVSIGNSASDLIDDSGVVTSTSVSWSGLELFDLPVGSLITQDRRLMAGFLRATPTIPATISVTGVPYTSYRVVVYSDSSNRQFFRRFQLSIGSQTIWGQDRGNRNFSGEFIQIPNTSVTDQGSFTPMGNFAVFEPTQGSSFVLTAIPGSVGTFTQPGGVPRGAINGFQIIEVPEPSSIALFALGIAGILAATSRRLMR